MSSIFIFSNLAISLDGKIATHERNFTPLGTSTDWKHMKELRNQCEAILVGASTFRAYQKASTTFNSASFQPVNLILSSSLEGISPKWRFFQSKKVRRILFVTEKISTQRIHAFDSTSEIIFLKKPTSKSPIPIQILTFLQDQGISRLLVEGGGGLMWDFAKLNLIDEYHVTLTPKIVGGTNAPTLVDGKGFCAHEILNLHLRQAKIVGNEIFLTYSKTKNTRRQ